MVLAAKNYTLAEVLALCSAIQVHNQPAPTSTSNPVFKGLSDAQQPHIIKGSTELPNPQIPIASTTPTLRRSRRLLGLAPLSIPVVPTPTHHRVAKPAVLAANKGSSRAHKRTPTLRRCKGKEIADPIPPTKIRLELINKFSFTDLNSIANLRMGFRYLGEDEEAGEGKSTLVLSLGTDMEEKELIGLDRMEVDVRLGFARDVD